MVINQRIRPVIQLDRQTNVYRSKMKAIIGTMCKNLCVSGYLQLFPVIAAATCRGFAVIAPGFAPALLAGGIGARGADEIRIDAIFGIPSSAKMRGCFHIGSEEHTRGVHGGYTPVLASGCFTIGTRPAVAVAADLSILAGKLWQIAKGCIQRTNARTSVHILGKKRIKRAGIFRSTSVLPPLSLLPLSPARPSAPVICARHPRECLSLA